MKIKICRRNPEEFVNRKEVFNFINFNNIWLIKNNPFYQKTILQKQNINFPDSRFLSLILRISQRRGPTFTRKFLTSNRARDNKHFFVGLEEKDLEELSKKTKISMRSLSCYNPPYIKELEFSSEERRKIILMLKKFKPDFVWVCVGSPKQEILANQLFKNYKADYFNVGAALDFLLGKKKEASQFFRKSGLEWFYRLITDFKYSKKKVWRSFIGLGYLISGRVELGEGE